MNLLVVFDAIYTQGGVTRAAKMLHVTQPTISHSLARLRERVGDPLFVRHGQKLVPTPMAHRMIKPVRTALQTIERTLADLDEFDPSTASASFSVGMPALMENAYFLPMATRAVQEAPAIHLNCEYFVRKELEADLSSGRLNAAVDVFLPFPDTIRKQALTSVRQVVVARKDHPAIRQGELDLDTYLSLGHILVTSRPQGLGPEDMALAREGVSRDIKLRCQHINTALRIVSQTDLVMTMSENYASRAYALGDSEIFTAPFNAPEVDIYLYWHINNDADPANRWLRDLIVDVCSTKV